ncbi:MAG: methyltransferase domain-containing protein [Deltaproteobacteria bacterium]|nr:methyltransferase domain-containing protein [Nannocystaceae bacterium]
MQPQGQPLSPREGYDRWAASYDDYDNPLVALEQPVVTAMIGEPRGLAIADIGCGTGRHAIALAQRGAHVTGVDGSPGMLAVLRRKAPQVSVVEHDIHHGIPLPDNSFMVVLCCLVLEHVSELDAAFGELARICQPGGHVVVSDLHPEQTRRGVHARFRESATVKREIAGHHHSISAYVMAALRAGLRIDTLHEHIVAADDLPGSRSVHKYRGEPLLFAMRLAR